MYRKQTNVSNTFTPEAREDRRMQHHRTMIQQDINMQQNRRMQLRLRRMGAEQKDVGQKDEGQKDVG